MTSLTDRIDRMEAEIRYLERELAAVRRLAGVTESEVQAVAAPWPKSASPYQEPDWSKLLGARALAWTGGGLTVLGVVFFFVLAVERGWIGESVRVGLGACASTLLVASALWLHRRFAETYAGVSAAGAGIAGWFACVVAASSIYHLLPDAAALALTGVIGVGGATLAIVWGSRTIGALGLVGAMLVAIPIASDHSLTTLGVSFVGLALVAACAVAVTRRWRVLALLAVAASAPQALVLVAEHRHAGVALALVFACLYLGTAVSLALREQAAEWWHVSFALTGAVTAAGGLALAYAGDLEGWTILVVAVAYVIAGIALRHSLGVFAASLVAIGLAVGAVASADLLSNISLTTAWAVEAVLLTWLARRIDRRFAWSASAFLALALVHVLSFEARPRDLFVAGAHPANGVPALLLVVAALVLATLWLDEFREPLAWATGASALYAASLGILAAFEASGNDVHSLFQRGHTTVSAMWALVGIGLLTWALRTDRRRLRIGGFALFGAALVKLFLYDLPQLSSVTRALSFFAVGAVMIAAGFVYQRVTSSSA